MVKEAVEFWFGAFPNEEQIVYISFVDDNLIIPTRLEDHIVFNAPHKEIGVTGGEFGPHRRATDLKEQLVVKFKYIMG